MESVFAILANIVLLALLGTVIAFSPTLIITELTVLTRSKRAVLHSLAFIAGIALAVVVFCLIAVLFIDPNRTIVIPSTREIIHSIPLADMVTGVLCLVIGARIARHRPVPVTAKPHGFQPEKLLSTKLLFWFGFIKTATSLSSITAILIAVRFILTSVSTNVLQLAAVVWLIGVALLPFALILFTKQYRPVRFAKIQNASNRAQAFEWRRTLALTFVLLGCYLVLNGVLYWEN